MANFKEIVTKAVVGKGKKTFSNVYTLQPNTSPSTILGCWVINHNFKGTKEKDSVRVEGSFDTNIWYSTDNNTKTEVAKETINYDELIPIKEEEDYDGEDEIIVRVLQQPNCTKAEINNGKINFTIEKIIAAEIVGDTKIKVEVNSIDEVPEEPITSTDEEIDKEVEEDFLKEKNET